jgi:branched-chain amino acid transport system substrate-binding protein
MTRFFGPEWGRGLRALRPIMTALACASGLFLSGAFAAEPVKIGLLTDQSGFSADIGGKGSVVAAHMAAEEFGNTVLDRPIVIVDADMLNKPDLAGDIVKRWFDSEGVDVVADVPVSSVALAVQFAARERKKALLISQATTTALTGEECSPYTIHWADDTYALSVGTAKALLANGAKKWFFISADMAFGKAMEGAASSVIAAGGGEIVGGVKHPPNTSDFSSYLLKAQASGADVIGLANVGADTITAIKQAAEFGITQGGQKILGFIIFITDVDALTLPVAKGLIVTASFYWDQNEGTRAFAKKFQQRFGKMPTKGQANTYQSIRHWLKAVAETGTTDASVVIPRMKQNPIDEFGVAGSIREDGRVLYPVTVWQVKDPSESKGRWDYYKPLRTIPATEAFLPLQPDKCGFLKH